MALIPWRPLWDLDRFFDEDWLEPWEPLVSRRLPKIRTPRMDVYETEKEVVAEFEMPGVNPENINVEVEEDALKVDAKTEEKKEEKKKGYYRKEISSASYRRVIPLPAAVKGNKADAKYEEGVLKVTIPKAEPKKKEKKSVKVKVKGKK